MLVGLGFRTLLNLSGFEIRFLFLGVVKALAVVLDGFKVVFGVAVIFLTGLVSPFPSTNFREIEEMMASLAILDFEGFAGTVSGHFGLELAKPKTNRNESLKPFIYFFLKWYEYKKSSLIY